MASAVLVVAIALLVLAQGGFFPLASCLLGVVVCVVAGIMWFRKPQRNQSVPIVALLFLGLAVSYATSAFVNGASLTTLSETGVWATCAGAAFLSAAQNHVGRAKWMKVLAWFGAATAIAGVLVCANVLPLPGGMVEERLQFTFQYANAAAAWYGICTFLCLLSPDARQRATAALPAAALLLTESGGGVIVFVACAVVVGIRWALSARWEQLFQALVQGAVAALLFVAVRLTMSPVALVPLAVVIAACWWLGKGGAALVKRVNARTASLVMAGVLVIGAIAAVFILSGRVADAAASLEERLWHVRDGLSLWLTQPVFGVGPDNWQYLYPYMQTAPYYTTVVHNSYIQLLLDAGIVGFAFFAAALVFGLRSLMRDARDARDANDARGARNAPDARSARSTRDSSNARSTESIAPRGGWAQAELLVAVFLLAHALLDFDLQFASLAFVLIALLAAPVVTATDAGNTKAAKAGNSSPKTTAKGPKGFVAGVTCLIVCLPLCVLGVLCASSTASLQIAEASGDYATCERLFLENPLAQADVSAQSHYLYACYNQGKYDEVEKVFNFMQTPTDRDVFYTALSYYSQNKQSQATSLLIKRLEDQPYNGEFLNGALQLVQAYGIDQSQSNQFNSAADHVRKLAA